MLCVELTSQQIDFLLEKIKQGREDENVATFEEYSQNKNNTDLISSANHRKGSFKFCKILSQNMIPKKSWYQDNKRTNYNNRHSWTTIHHRYLSPNEVLSPSNTNLLKDAFRSCVSKQKSRKTSVDNSI